MTIEPEALIWKAKDSSSCDSVFFLVVFLIDKYKNNSYKINLKNGLSFDCE